MMLVLQILVVLGMGMVIYALWGIFFPPNPSSAKQKININPLSPSTDPGKEQKIQRLQNDLVQLKDELSKVNAEYVETKSAFTVSKENEAKLTDELKRRSEWVTKAEAELFKIKSEDSDLSGKFAAKEKELQEEFTKNVDLSRVIRDLKTALDDKEMACRLKEDQIQAQKHQIEEQLKSIKEHQVTITEFNRKEKINEWVPKAEFNKLNQEYSELEKELESGQERLKSFAEEIAHLRKEVKIAEPIKQLEEVKQVEEPKPAQGVQQVEESQPREETQPIEKIKQEEIKPVEENSERPEEKNEPKEEEK